MAQLNFTYIFEVVHLDDFLAPVSHPEDLHSLTWVDLQHAFCLDAIQHGFVVMVIHLQRHKPQHHTVTGASDRSIMGLFSYFKFTQSSTSQSTDH